MIQAFISLQFISQDVVSSNAQHILHRNKTSIYTAISKRKRNTNVFRITCRGHLNIYFSQHDTGANQRAFWTSNEIIIQILLTSMKGRGDMRPSQVEQRNMANYFGEQENIVYYF